MTIPEYLKHLVDKDSVEESTFTLAVNNTKEFEVYYVGIIDKIDDTLYITPEYNSSVEENPISRILIKEKGSDTMHSVYDGAIHGYNNMFCDEHNSDIKYELQKLELDGFDQFAVTVTLGYGIDYDDEKEDYEVDADDMVEVMNRDHKISWQQVKEEGYDWLTIQFAASNGKSVFLDEELA